MVDKTPADLTAGTASDTSVVHSSEDNLTNKSRKHTERDISRLQANAPTYSAAKTYIINDLVTESGIVFRNIIAIVTPEAFNPTKWLAVTGDLQAAYDTGSIIKIDDTTPITLQAPDGPASLFQPIIEVEDQDGDFPIIIEAGGEMEQQPLNLKLVSTLISSPSSLIGASVFDIHSRFAFINTGATPPGIEVFSIADPELPRKITTIDATVLSSPGFFQHHGDILYAVDTSEPSLKVIDIGVPTDPKVLGKLDDGTDGARIDGRYVIQGCFVYIISFSLDTLSIINVSDPANIEVVRVVLGGEIITLTNLAGTLSGYTDGEEITFSSGSGVNATGTAVISGGVIQSVTLVSGGEQYPVGQPLTITGVTSTTNTATIDVATIFDLFRPARLTIHENFLFIANTGSDLSVDGFVTCIDISDPANPNQLSKILNGASLGSPGDPPFLDEVVNIHATRDVVHFCDKANKAFTTIDYSDPTTPVVTDFIRDGVDGVSLGEVDRCVIAGKYAYIANRTGTPNRSLEVATINIQDPTDLKFLKNVFIAGPTIATEQPIIGLQVTGDHLYMVNSAISTNGRFYSIRLSGIDTQSIRAGAGRFGDLDVKDELTARSLEASESLVVGGRGILSQGKFGGSKSSDIKRSVITVVIAGPTDTVVLDMTDDITTYIIDATGITADWNIDVKNIKVGHKILVQVLLPAGNDDLIFTPAKFAIDMGNTDIMGTTGDLAVIEAVLDTGADNTVIVTITEI